MANIDNFVPNALLELCSRTLDVLTQVTRMLTQVTRMLTQVTRIRQYAGACSHRCTHAHTGHTHATYAGAC